MENPIEEWENEGSSVSPESTDDCRPTFQGLLDQESEEPHGSFPFLEDY